MPKQVLFNDEGRAALLRGNQRGWPRRSRPPWAPRAAIIDKKFDSPPSPGRRDGSQGDRAQDPFENMGAQMPAEVASRPPTMRMTGPPTANGAGPRPIVRAGLKERHRGRQSQRASGAGSIRRWRRWSSWKRMSKSTKDRKGDTAGRHHRVQQRQDHRRSARRGDGEGGARTASSPWRVEAGAETVRWTRSKGMQS